MRQWLVLLALPLFLAQFGCVSPVPSQEKVALSFRAGNSEAGEIVWHDLLTGEPQVAIQFYGDLFGWSFENVGRATFIKLDQRVIGSIMEMPATQTHHATRWVASLGVPNVVTATQWTEQQGGSVHEGPFHMRNRGEVALVSDPLGAQIGLVELGPKSITEPSSVETNDWLWDELWTQDTHQALAFYSGLYEFTSDEVTPGYWVLKSGEQWRAGIRELFDPDLEQRWVPVIRVDDVQAISLRAQQLGGKLIIAAQNDEEHDPTALIADPGGALFMVQVWSGKSALKGVSE